MGSVRKIIHVDMDAFYASIEQRDNPEYRGKPLAVGGVKERGVVAAASYEARKYGVRSAMPTLTARKICKNLIVIPPRFEVYKKVSSRIMAILQSFTDIVEPLSLDEAYLDVTENKLNIPSATLIAKEIKKRIREETGLTASAGVSFNKFLAKVASDMKKPDGLFIIKPGVAEKLVEKLPIEKFHGIGRVTAGKMHKIGIYKGADLKNKSKAELVRLFGKNGSYYYNISRAVDNRPVNPVWIRKSLSTEKTFEKDLDNVAELEDALEIIASDLWHEIQKKRFFGKTLTVKIKFADFQQITRSRTMEHPFDQLEVVRSVAKELLQKGMNGNKNIRLLGLGVSNLEEPPEKEDARQMILDL